MKTKLLLMGIMGSVALFMYSCQKKDAPKETASKTIPQETLDAIKKQGFGTIGAMRWKDGYVVEGDIFLSDSSLTKKMSSQTLQRGNIEQYRTTQLVTGLPRTINIFVSGLGSQYQEATDEAIKRYNDLRLGGITFARIGSILGANIVIDTYCPPEFIGLSDFPQANGEPGYRIHLNTSYFFQGANQGAWAASVIEHEMGHCIGMRHTDYMNRAFSCGIGGIESDPTNAGAVQIPNTVSGPESESWMLACIPNGISRTFTIYDILALAYLYSPGQTPAPQLMYEWYNSGTYDHALSANGNIQNLYSGWSYNQYSHRVYLTNVSGTVPLYEFYNAGIQKHLYSTNINATSGMSGVWGRITVGYVYTTQVAGTIPVYYYYNSGSNDRVYSADPDIQTKYPVYIYQGIAYYAFPK